MAHAVLALGANIGDPVGQIHAAIEEISGHPQITLLRQSTIIVTPPWGVTEQNDFHNGALAIETDLEPLDLLEFCLATENMLGRRRVQKWGPRVIDIDIVAYDRLEMQTDVLTLPHPLAHEREFVMVPVREIAPDVADWLAARGRRSG